MAASGQIQLSQPFPERLLARQVTPDSRPALLHQRDRQGRATKRPWDN
jgi:hypothetical protein